VQKGWDSAPFPRHPPHIHIIIIVVISELPSSKKNTMASFDVVDDNSLRFFLNGEAVVITADEIKRGNLGMGQQQQQQQQQQQRIVSLTIVPLGDTR
jgi:hypothetical protein